jgi:hypothetical protein
MPALQIRPLFLAAALTAAATVGMVSTASGQTAREQKMAAASRAQSSSGSVPLRVGLVISEAVRTYRTSYMFSHIDFGKHLATQAELVFDQSFAAVRPMMELPGDAHAIEGLNLLIVLDGLEGSAHQSGLVSGTVTLAVRFTVRDASGAQLFQLQETGSEKGSNTNNMLDRLGEAIARKFVQDLLVDPRARALLSPASAAAPAETKPVLEDTAAMDSSGLDVPPPPPWAPPTPAAGAPSSVGKP